MTTTTPDHPKVGRFEWENALLNSGLPWHHKAFLLLLGTKMDVDGSNCRPPASWLMSKMGRSRQRVFELFEETEAAGWLVTVSRPGKASLRVPQIPTNPSDTSDNDEGSQQDKASDTSYGSDAPEVIHTRQTGLTQESDPSDPTRQTGLTQPTKTNQDQPLGAGARPQTPLRPEAPQAAPRTELEPEPEQSKTPRTELDPETQVPQRARRVRCEHGLAPGTDANGIPRCPVCRRVTAPVAPVIQLRPPDRSAS